MAKSVLFYRSGPFSVGAVKFDLLLEAQHNLKSTVTKHPVEASNPVADHVVRELRTGSLKGFVSNFSLSLPTTLPDSIQRLLGPSARSYAGLAASVGVGLLGGVLSAQSDLVQKAGSVALGAGIAAAGSLSKWPSEEAVKEALAGLERPANRVRDTFTLFEQLWLAGEPVTIVTGLKKYENMMIVDVSTEENESTGESGEFSVQFEEFRRVSTKKISISAAIAPRLTTPEGRQASPKVAAGRTTGTGKVSDASKKALTTKVGAK